ncbi:unnamed protein product [Prorocentrum cordatum]|uniref:Uncharacterized protein n=1 Tax=Prorocentrum cordatum TaxID=2364126 RepID=A0ABN9XV18_9DINO|nr:unnamed protein product [Polarella glacialis]
MGACSLVVKFSKPTALIDDRTDRRDVQKLREVLNVFLQDRYRAAVECHASERVLIRYYSSDGTPLLMNASWKRRLGPKTVRRKGKRCDEMLCERLYLKTYDYQGRRQCHVVVRDPVPLTAKKGGCALLACCEALAPSVRECFFFGPALNVYCWDRGCFSICSRLVWQAHSLRNSESTRASAYIDSLLDFVIAIPDLLHDANNALLWSLRQWVSAEGVCKDVWCAITAIGNAYDVIMLNLDGWIQAKILWTDAPATAEFCRELWACFELEDDVVEVLVNCRVLWRRGRLEARDQVQHVTGTIGDISGALVGAWRFVKFSESRWLGLATSGRPLVAAHLLGIGGLIEFARQGKDNAEYRIRIYSRFKEDARLLVSIASLSCGAAEAAANCLLQDGRLLRNYDIIQRAVEDNAAFVHGISYGIFEHVAAEMFGGDGVSFRSKVVLSTTIGAGFMSNRFFDKGSELPWSLCIGDPMENLEALAGKGEPSEPVSKQLHELWHLGYPKEILREVVEEFSDVEHTSLGVEQSHASAAQVLRHHPEMERDAVQCRAFLGAARAFLNPARVDLDLEKYRKKICTFKTKCTMTGRNLYLKECFAKAKQRNGNRRLAPDVRESIMTKHGTEYAKLSDEQRFRYEHQAQLISDDIGMEAHAQLQELRQSLSIAEMRAEESKAGQSSWSFDACKFSDEDKAVFDAMYQRDRRFTRAAVERMRTDACKAPPVPDVGAKLRMNAQPLPQSPPVVRPRWLAEVCQKREHFAAVCWAVQPPGQAAAYYHMFLYAYQNPQFMQVVCLARRAWDPAGPRGGDSPADRCDWMWDFSITNAYKDSSKHMATWDVDHVVVIDRLTLLGNRRAVSDAPAQPLRRFLASLPDPPRPAKAPDGSVQGGPVHTSARAKMVAENPWLLDVIDDAQPIRQKRKRDPRGEGPDAAECELEDAFGDDALEPEVLGAEFWQDLAEARALVAGGGGPDHFGLKPLGGEWTHAHLNVAHEAWQGRAASPLAKQFLEKYTLKGYMRFDVSLYTNEGALVCARYWVAGMSYFFDLWRGLGRCDAHAFTEAEIASFREPEEFTELTVSCTKPAAQKRFTMLRGLFPTGNGT